MIAIVFAVLVHVVVVFYCFFGRISFEPIERSHLLELDFTVPEEEVLSEEELENELDQTVPLGKQVSNATANQQKEKSTYTNSRTNQSDLDDEVWQETKDLEKQIMDEIGLTERLKENKEIDERAKVSEHSVKEDVEQNDDAELGRDAGVTTADYSLTDRKPLRDRKPSYNALESGRVHIDIKVTRKGSISSVTFNRSRSTTDNDYLIEQALKYAKRWRFTQDFNAPMLQKGYIVFTFVEQ